MDFKHQSDNTKNKFTEELDENGDVIIVEQPRESCDAAMNSASNMNSMVGT